MKTILFILQEYYPLFTGGVPRVACFCKYLQDYGWRPILLAEDCRNYENAFAHEDCCETIRVPRDIPPSYPDHYPHSEFIRRFFHVAIGDQPDASGRNLARKMLEQGREICRTHRIDVIFASSLPQFTHMIGMTLSREFGIPWIADHRDVIGQVPIPGYLSPIKKLVTRLYDGCIAFHDTKYERSASRIITVSQELADILHKRTRRSIDIIMNGFDEDDFFERDKPGKNPKLRIVYTGSFFQRTEPSLPLFMDGLKDFVLEHPDLNEAVSVEFYGSCCDEVRKRLETERWSILSDIIKTLGTVSHKDALDAICTADVLYFVSHPAKLVSGKIFEFIASGRPILSVPGDQGITDEILAGSRLGRIARDASEVKTSLYELISEWKERGEIATAPNWEFISQFSRRKEAGALAEILEKIHTA